MSHSIFADASPELKYILECSKALADKRYEEAMLIFQKGLVESEQQADRIRVSELITLLRFLLLEIELNLGADFAVRWRKMAELPAQKTEEPNCSFCAKKQSEVLKIIAGHGAFICDECIRRSLDILISSLASLDSHGK
jgi:hypothetical protein